MSNIQLIDAKDLSLTTSALNKKQLQMLLKHTPEKYVRTRPAKGGGQWKYVSGGYVKKVLNMMFGFNWTFEVVEKTIIHGEAIVLGKLTIQSNGTTITKMQFGNKEIICKRGTDQPLSIGNDLKSATTDALKKCAAELGIAADIYNAEEFREVTIDTNDPTEEDLQWLLTEKADKVTPELKANATRIIEGKEVASYGKLWRALNEL